MVSQIASGLVVFGFLFAILIGVELVVFVAWLLVALARLGVDAFGPVTERAKDRIPVEWTIEKADVGQHHAWFAWFPVLVDTHHNRKQSTVTATYQWLCLVSRRRTGGKWVYASYLRDADGRMVR